MEYAVETTTTAPAVAATTAAAELYAEYIAAPASSMSPAAIAEHMQQNRITFEIPTARDLRHIDALHSFNALLQRIGNAAAVSYDSSSSGGGSITTEQLSNSVVLDLADLRDNEADASSSSSLWEQIFGDADMHELVNYLWIGVVTSLVILSLVFILFSCYFYRKFRTWKKCSKYSSLSNLQASACFDLIKGHFVGQNNIKCRTACHTVPATVCAPVSASASGTAFAPVSTTVPPVAVPPQCALPRTVSVLINFWRAVILDTQVYDATKYMSRIFIILNWPAPKFPLSIPPPATLLSGRQRHALYECDNMENIWLLQWKKGVKLRVWVCVCFEWTMINKQMSSAQSAVDKVEINEWEMIKAERAALKSWFGYLTMKSI